MHYNSDVSDDTGRSWTKAGTADYTTSDHEFGAGCLNLPGAAANYIYTAASSDFNFGTGDFTIEFWFKTSATAGCIICNLDGANAYNSSSIDLWIASSNVLQWSPIYDGSHNIQTSGGTPTDGNWHHIACVRYGNLYTVYIDGTDRGHATYTGLNITAASNDLLVGRDGAGSWPIAAKVDELRISKGIARYTGNFTSPTSEFALNASPSASISPSISPSVSPSASPSKSPSASPSLSPSASVSPSISPSVSPSASMSPSRSPSGSPSVSPSSSPSVSPSLSPSTAGGGDLTNPSGTATADEYATGMDASHAFDDTFDYLGGWNTNGGSFPHWIQYDFGSGHTEVVTKARLWVGSSSMCQWEPSAFTILGSNTGSFSGEETTLKTVSEVTEQDWDDAWNDVEYLEWSFANSTSYRYVRIKITANCESGDTDIWIRQIEYL